MSQDTSVVIATGYVLEGQGSIPKRDEYLFLHRVVQSVSGSQTVSFGMCTVRSFFGCKAVGSGCEVCPSPPSSAEVKNGGAVPPLFFMF
jgi:hypothetical protein